MAPEITREEVEWLVSAGACVVDVLEPKAYADSHLPDAINIPLPNLADEALLLLDPNRPTIVYCYDSKCDRSSRGAARLESLGFRHVYDYKASKIDWIAAGRPFAGTRAEEPRLATLADPRVPTCGLRERTSVVRDRIGDAPVLVVINEDRVVLGVVGREALSGPDAVVMAVMEEGPQTFRPHVNAQKAREILDKSPQPWILVTNLQGTLVGIADPMRVRETATESRLAEAAATTASA